MTRIVPLPGVAARVVTAVARVAGVIAGLDVEAGPAPAALFAVTVIVYSVPLARPVMVQGLVVQVVSVIG
ncbi:MAG: hypothetical protein ACO39Q_09430, partial [Ilumatobacteraceae bacterium]